MRGCKGILISNIIMLMTHEENFGIFCIEIVYCEITVENRTFYWEVMISFVHFF